MAAGTIMHVLKDLVPQRSSLRLVYHYVRALLAALRYGFPARHLTVIGVTGTDGKTTTISMIAHILREAGRSVGSITTTAITINGLSEPNTTQKTSINPVLLQSTLHRMVNSGCEFAVLEVSSHGLVQGRVHHIMPKIAAITNTSEEHLDYHGTMEQYRFDKGKLFRMLRGAGTKVLNDLDGTYELYKDIPSFDTMTYGSPDADFRVSDTKAQSAGSRTTLHTDLGGTHELILTIPGVFHIENALCAITCASAAGIPIAMSVRALEYFRGVEGRLERIDEGQEFNVYVDFTVTPAAYERILQTLRSVTPQDKRLLVLAGSCGNRMREKRPKIGKICCDLADYVVITSDETYSEPHETIMEEIWSGMDHRKTQAIKILDRREAIEHILSRARPGDTVIFCGMAGVTTMMTENGQIPWNEAEIVRDMLRKI